MEYLNSFAPYNVHKPKAHAVAFAKAGVHTELNDPTLNLIHIAPRKLPHTPGSPVTFSFNDITGVYSFLKQEFLEQRDRPDCGTGTSGYTS